MFPQRKPLRLKGYDYSTEGAYFVTVCALERKALLGCVVGTGVLARPQDAHEGSLPGVELSPYGVAVDKVIRQLHEFYKDISVDYYTIMPNHIHLLLSVSEKSLQKLAAITISIKYYLISLVFLVFRNFQKRLHFPTLSVLYQHHAKKCMVVCNDRKAHARRDRNCRPP